MVTNVTYYLLLIASLMHIGITQSMEIGENTNAYKYLFRLGVHFNFNFENFILIQFTSNSKISRLH